MKHASLITGVLCIALSACGGGGGDSGPSAPSEAEGLWFGTTNTNRSIAGVVLDTGTYWFIYTSQGNNAVVAGAIQGTGSTDNGSFSSSNGRDFNLEGQGINNFTISGTYSSMQSLAGTIRYSATGEQVTFSSQYDSYYDETPSLSIVAGNYSGTAATSAGTESANVVVSSNGAVSGQGASGCTFTGSAAPRESGNVYDLSITFGGGVCQNGGATVNGVAIYDPEFQQITSAALNSPRSDGFIFIGEKP